MKIGATLATRPLINEVLDDFTGKQIRAKAVELGKLMAKKASDRIPESGDPQRRRHPGSRRLKNAISYQVESGSGFPIEVSYRILGGQVVVNRAVILNFSKTTGYPIPPNASPPWSLRGYRKPLQTSPRPYRPSASGNQLAWLVGGRWVNIARNQPVPWEGSFPHFGFLEESADEAFAEWASTLRR